MKGARDYAKLFTTGQYGRLYIVSGSHARGLTFHIYILPAGVEAVGNGPNNGPLNPNAVEVYGITGGQPGWTETYGWLHNGKWQNDFHALYIAALEQRDAEEKERLRSDDFKRIDRESKIRSLLAQY